MTPGGSKYYHPHSRSSLIGYRRSAAHILGDPLRLGAGDRRAGHGDNRRPFFNSPLIPATVIPIFHGPFAEATTVAVGRGVADADRHRPADPDKARRVL